MTSQPIALLGQKRSGKDTVADILVANHGYTKLAFADSLRELLLLIDPLVPNPAWTGGGPCYLKLSVVIRLYGWEGWKIRDEDSYRHILRSHGHESVSKLMPTYFTTLLEQRMVALIAAGKPVVVSDIRFPEELALMEVYGARTVRVVRTGLPIDTHVSETGLADAPVSITLRNDGSLEDLSAAVSRLVTGR